MLNLISFFIRFLPRFPDDWRDDNDWVVTLLATNRIFFLTRNNDALKSIFVLLCALITNEKWFIELKITLYTYCGYTVRNNHFFSKNFNFDLPRKIIFFKGKNRENWLAVNNCNFTRKIVEKYLGEKFVKF